MIISVNWLKELVDLDDVAVDELARIIGARLVEVEEVIDLGQKYQGAIVAEIKECSPIPDTHLFLCQIDAGTGESVQVVTGAPNAKKGLVTVWLGPGTTVPSTYGTDDPFVLGVRKMRGYDSNGMLAGADELDLSEDHSSIIDLGDFGAKPGDHLADVLGLNDFLLDIENKSLTHRPDCFGVIGFAREVAGILGKESKTPDFLLHSSNLQSSSDEQVTISVENHELCSAYRAVVMGINSNYITDSSKCQGQLGEIAIKLLKSGMRPIDPVVDISNYLMLLTGQPLHFFDYDKLIKVGGMDHAKITVRSAKNGEKIELLDGKVLEMTTGDIVICSGETPVALAGAMGAKNTVVDSTTKRILVEAATFSLYKLRSTSMRYGIFSEALTRFTKGQPAELSRLVIDDAVKMLQDDCQMTILSKIHADAAKFESIKMEINPAKINQILGTDYTYDQIETTLKNVGFKVGCDCGQEGKCECQNINIEVPYWRTDIHILEDVAEEIGRLNGFDEIPLELPTRPTKQVAPDRLGDFKRQLRQVLAGFGANEVLTYSFVSEKLLTRSGQNPDNSYRLVNSISPELQYYRQSLLPSLAEKVYLNVKMAYNQFGLFEINRVSSKDAGLNHEKVPVEEDRLALVLADRKTVDWHNGEAFYAAKEYLMMLMREIGINTGEIELAEIDDGPTADSLNPGRAVSVKHHGETIGYLGEFDSQMKQELKLPNFVAGFELNLNKLLELPRKAKTISMSQVFEFDISVRISSQISFGKIEKAIRDKLSQMTDSQELKPLDIYQNGDGVKTCSWRVSFSRYEEALTKTGALTIMEAVGGTVDELGGQII